MNDSDSELTPRRRLSRSDSIFHEQQALRRSEFHSRRYIVFGAECMTDMAQKLEVLHKDRFCYYSIDWNKFPDGTDNITIEGYSPTNQIAGEHVLFFASFHNNDVTLSQFSVFIVLLQSFVASLTIVLPYYPVGTNERVDIEGKVATANTYSHLLSSLPNCGKPTRLMIYDIHALQERFYFHASCVPSLHSTIPLIFDLLKSNSITTVVFPDDGAAKRFKSMFKSFDVVICGKVRDGDIRKVNIQDGNPSGEQMTS